MHFFFSAEVADGEIFRLRGRRMELDNRLRALADLVPPKSRVADIGTDHAYLSVYLVENGKAEFVVAGDKNSGPCEAAARTVRLSGHEDRISVRQGDGLSVLAPGEVDTICIAGMGGGLMCEILGACPKVLKAVGTLVLQPMNDSLELRRWMYRHSWHIEDETLAVAEGRLYEIVMAKKGRRRQPSRIMMEIGPILWEKKTELLRHHMKALLFRNKRIAAGMEKSEEARRSRKYKEIRKDIKTLEEMLKW